MSQSRYDELLAVDGPGIAIEVERSESVRDPTLTLSADAMETLKTTMVLWVGSRMSRAMSRGHIPQRVTVHVAVSLDGELAQ